MSNSRAKLWIVFVLILSACSTPTPTATPIPPTAPLAPTGTRVPPTVAPVLSTSVPPQTELLKAGSGSFAFRDVRDRLINVYFYRPDNIDANTEILFAMHGSERNGRTMRDTWAEHAKAKNFIVLAPEFSAAAFPGEDYILGDMYNNNLPTDKVQWTFTSLEKIFDQVKTATRLNATSYNLYGHSAGAQFVHRMIEFMPDARIKKAVAANAGWYTMPQDDIEVPYGLKGTNTSREDLSKVFGKALTILLGEQDNDENDPDLRKTAQANAQGKNRLERGKMFYKTASQVAETKQIKFVWDLKLVPNVGHDNIAMAKPAAELLFPVAQIPVITQTPAATLVAVALQAPAATLTPAPTAVALTAGEYAKMIEASKKENTLLIYSINSAANWRPVITAFNEKYPWIKVTNVNLETDEVFDRYYSETATKSKTADLIVTCSPDGWQELIAKGQVAPYKSSEDSKLPDWTKPAPNIYTLSTDPMVLIWNKSAVPNAPKTMAELAALVEKDPSKFVGKLTTYDAETYAIGLAVNWFWIKKQGENGWKILESLGKAKPVLQTAGARMVDATMAGETSIGFFVSGVTVFSKYPAAEPAMGNSMFADGTPILLRAMGITQAGANPNSAKLMLDFILSEVGQTQVGEGGLTAYRPDVVNKTKNHLTKLTATVGEQNLIPFYLDPDFKDKAKKDAFIARWKKAMGKP